MAEIRLNEYIFGSQREENLESIINLTRDKINEIEEDEVDVELKANCGSTYYALQKLDQEFDQKMKVVQELSNASANLEGAVREQWVETVNELANKILENAHQKYHNYYCMVLRSRSNKVKQNEREKSRLDRLSRTTLGVPISLSGLDTSSLENVRRTFISQPSIMVPVQEPERRVQNINNTLTRVEQARLQLEPSPILIANQTNDISFSGNSGRAMEAANRPQQNTTNFDDNIFD